MKKPKPLTKEENDRLDECVRESELDRKGCVGRRIRIEVEKPDTLLQQEDGTVGVGKVMSAGPDVTTCRVGDRISFTYWAKDKVTIDEKENVYILATDVFVCEIL